MFAERLTVIGDDDDDRPIELSGGSELIETTPDHRVRIGHLGVVR